MDEIIELMKNNDPTPQPKSSGTKDFLKKFENDSSLKEVTDQFSNDIDASGFDTTFNSDKKYNDDYLDGSENYQGNLDIEELRAQSQPWANKFATGIARVGTKVISEVAKMPGMIGGALGSPFMEGDAIENMFNNSWIRAIEGISEEINEDVLPIYVKKSVEEGDIFKNLSSIDFWATEGADGVGYIASMLVPGTAISKLGAGAKLLRGINKGANKLYGTTEKAQKALSALNITDKNIDVFNATLANTFFEAGAESGNAMRALELKLEDKLANGEISESDFSNRKAELGRNIFWDNVAILLGPNLITNKILLGKVKPSITKESFINSQGKLLTELSKPTTKQLINKYGQEFGKGFLREGFFEEGLQSTSETIRSKNAEEGDLDYFQGDFIEGYFDMIKSTDGQKAIALGGLLGGPMNAYNKFKTDKADKKRHNAIIQSMQNSLNYFEKSLSDIYKKDSNGEYILDDNNKKVIDPNSESQFLSQIQQLEEVNETLDILKIMGNKDVSEIAGLEKLVGLNAEQLHDNIREQLTSSFVLPFVKQGEVGIEVLKEQLSTMNNLVDKVDQYSNAFSTNLTKNNYISDIIEKASYIQKEYNKINPYIRPILNISTKNRDKNIIENFYQSLENTYLSNKSRELYLNDIQNKYEQILNEHTSDIYSNSIKSKRSLSKIYSKYKIEGRTNLLKEKGTDITEDEFNEIVLSSDPIFSTYKNNIDNIKKEIENINKINFDIFDPKKAEAAFKIYENQYKEIEKINSKENIDNTENTINDINDAKTKDDLEEVENNVSNLDDNVKDIVKDKIDSKKNEIDKNQTDISQKNIEQVNADKEYDIGDIVKFGEKTLIIDVDGENNIILLDENGDLNELASKLIGPVVKLKKIDPSNDNAEYDENEEDDNTRDVNKEQDKEDNILENNNDENSISLKYNNAKVIGYSENNGVITFKSFNKAFESYINNNNDKVGTKVYFTIATPSNNDHKIAIKQFNEITSEEVDKLFKGNITSLEGDKINKIANVISNLPIQVNISDNVYSFLSGQPKKGSKQIAHEIFSEIEMPLRVEIIKEALNKGNFENITSEITFQTSGKLQNAPLVNKKIPENNILDIDQISEIKDVELFYMDKNGQNLKNESKNKAKGIRINKTGSKAGYIYMKVKRPNGKAFPLKLNVKRLSRENAIFVTEIIDNIFNNNLTPESFLSELPESFKNLIQNDYKEELNLFKKPFKDIRLHELLDLFVYDNSDSKYKFKIQGGSLHYGNKKANSKSFSQFKSNVIDWLENNKRRNINFDILSNNKNIDPLKYKEYLINNKILNTDTVINQPLFKGSNIFIKNTIINNPLNKPTEVVSLNKDNSNELIEELNDTILDQIDSIEDLYNEDDTDTKC